MTKDRAEKKKKKKVKSGWREIGKLGNLFYMNRGRNPAQVISLNLFYF